MSTYVPLLEKDRIVVGKPLPFSIFTAERKLLLAAGQVVPSERLRDMLVTSGEYRSAMGGDDEQTAGAIEEEETPQAWESPLDLLRRDYDSAKEHRLAISIARTETEKAYAVQLLGTHKQCIIVTAPVHPDGALVPVTPGQAWLCRTFQMTSAFRFRTVALKAAFEPFPHLHLQLQKDVEYRKVRGAPRAKVSVLAELHTPDAVPCVVADLSIGGARIAIDSPTTLERGQAVRLATTLDVLESRFQMALEGTVANLFGPADARHPHVAFYGVRFSAPAELDSLVLHGFVSKHLVAEFHSLWQMLSMVSAVSTSNI